MASIVLAATLAVGVGVVLARDERDRRLRDARRARDRRFGLVPGEAPSDGLRRMALGQLDLAIELLDAERSRLPPAAAVHDTRKALKRVRALVRALRPQLGEKEFVHEDAILRDCGRRLSGVRDAEVMVATLDGLLARNRKQLAHLSAVRRLRAQFAGERDWAEQHALADRATRSEIAGRLLELRARTESWRLTGRDLRVCEPGLRSLYRQGRRRWRRAQRRTEDGRALHLWRKRVKDLRYAAEMLERRPPRGSGDGAHGATGGATGSGGRGAWLHRVARRADELGEVLGEEHDLAVLAERVRASSEPFAHDAAARKTLLKLIARRRRRLRSRALRSGQRLYGRPPKRFARRVRRAYVAQK